MTSTAQELSDLLVDAAAQADRALVHVSAQCRRGATGSAFSGDGVILTTARAVAGRERVEVVRGDDATEARVVGFDMASDIGVLRTDAVLGGAPTWVQAPAQLGTLLVIASRPGRAARVRLGVVSQLGEAWHTPRGARVDRYVETDVAPEPGFSGGLAFDARGQAVGMLSAGLLRGAPLLLEKPTLERVVAALLSHGRVRRGYLGVGTQAVRLPDALAASRGQKWGLLVASVQPGSAADSGGILLGDVLLSLGGQTLVGAGALQASLEDAEGTALPLSLWRGGQELTLELTPGARS